MPKKTENSKEQKNNLKELNKKTTATKKSTNKIDVKPQKEVKKVTAVAKEPATKSSTARKSSSSPKKQVSSKKATEKKSTGEAVKRTKTGTGSKPKHEAKKTLAGSKKPVIKKETVNKTAKKATTRTKTSKTNNVDKKENMKTSSKPKHEAKNTKTKNVESKTTNTSVKPATTKKKEIIKDTKLTKENKIEINSENQLITVKQKAPKINEETIIEKIKNFLSKIISIQEEKIETKKVAKKEKQLKGKEKKEKKQQNEVAGHILEYYDLPFRYNETVVKILAQTPKRLFVYWDISDGDREKYLSIFGENFFMETYPVLLLHNEDKGYWKEIQINDFANSWYIDIGDTKSKYSVQLGRKFKSKPEVINIAKMQEESLTLKNDYLFIVQSNKLEAPNDHILFERFCSVIKFRNIKTNEEYTKKFNGAEFKDKVGKTYNIYDIYAELYNEEVEEGVFDMSNPNSATIERVNSSFFK